MVDKELKRMKRSDFLEILLRQNREIERLQEELAEAKRQLSSREIAISQSGSLAEAALTLNGVFSAAQAACEQYVENMQQRSEQQDKICAEMERETKEKCERMILEAQKQADAHWEETQKKIQQVLKESDELKKLLAL